MDLGIYLIIAALVGGFGLQTSKFIVQGVTARVRLIPNSVANATESDGNV